MILVTHYNDRYHGPFYRQNQTLYVMEEDISDKMSEEGEEEDYENMDVDEDNERLLPSLPMEVWVAVFSHLSGPSLFRCSITAQRR